MKRIVMLLAATFVSTAVLAQNAPAPVARQIISRVEPNYPDVARRMNIQGTVKIAAEVRANGSVKSTRVLGGSPVLAEAARDAVSRWKFALGQNETTEVVQITFAPKGSH
jgi:TonB family protein